MIVIENVTKKYGAFTAIEDISCTIEDGSIYGLVGYNGAGKTTLIKTAAGIYRPERGRVVIDGENIYDNENLRTSLFIIPDELYFIPGATLNSMKRLYMGYYPDWNGRTYKRLVEIFKLDPGQKIEGFSKGMQRQAGILLALSAMPRYLLMDEAFDGLDLSKRNLLNRLLRKYLEVKKAIIIVSSHNLKELEGIADSVGIIRDKRLFFNSAVSSIRERCGKYRVSFNTEIKAQQLMNIGARDLKKEGNTFTFIAGGRQEEVKEKIQGLMPQKVEVSAVTLEEFFIEEGGEAEYDFNDIF